MFYQIICDVLGPDNGYRKMQHQELLELWELFEKELLLYSFRRGRGNQYQACKFFGCNRNTYRKRLRKYGITSDDLYNAPCLPGRLGRWDGVDLRQDGGRHDIRPEGQ